MSTLWDIYLNTIGTKKHIDLFQYVRMIVRMENYHLDNARVFKAFCDENRLQILKLLQSGEKCACVLLENLEISQPTLSHHMKILCESGIVSSRKDGKWTYYAINTSGVEATKKLLSKLTEVEKK